MQIAVKAVCQLRQSRLSIALPILTFGSRSGARDRKGIVVMCMAELVIDLIVRTTSLPGASRGMLRSNLGAARNRALVVRQPLMVRGLIVTQDTRIGFWDGRPTKKNGAARRRTADAEATPHKSMVTIATKVWPLGRRVGRPHSRFGAVRRTTVLAIPLIAHRGRRSSGPHSSGRIAEPSWLAFQSSLPLECTIAHSRPRHRQRGHRTKGTIVVRRAARAANMIALKQLATPHRIGSRTANLGAVLSCTSASIPLLRWSRQSSHLTSLRCRPPRAFRS